MTASFQLEKNVCVRKASLVLPLYILVLVPSQEIERVLVISIFFSISMIFLLDVGTVPTEWYFFSPLLSLILSQIPN